MKDKPPKMSNEDKSTSCVGARTVLAIVLLIFICAGGVIGYFSHHTRPAGGSIEISFKINDPLRYPDDEPLDDPQTVIWLEDSRGQYVRSILVSDWTSSEGWEKTVKLPDKTEIKEICPQWQAASGWPKNHSKKTIDAVTKATPETGDHEISVKCADLKLKVGTYRYCVQTSVAELHSILCIGTITIGDEPDESIATVLYKPELHKDAGGVLSDVKAVYTP